MNAANPQTIHRVMHDIKRRKLEVLRVVELTPRMRRITLAGPELAGFTSLGSDDHVKLFFPQTAEELATLETLDLSAGLKSSIMPPMRDYTPRRIDLNSFELDIDFVLHGDGPAATWAAQAEPGQSLHIGGPRSSMVVPDIFDRYLLIGDETALPAIARRLEELPANRHALVVVEVENALEEQVLNSAASVEVIWVHRDAPVEDLLKTVEALTPPEGQLYTWVATESALSRKVRKVLLNTHGLNDEFVKAVGYWRLEE